MLEYLQSIFGPDIRTEQWILPAGAPFYIRDGYSFQKLIWNRQACLLVKPNDPSTRLPTLKKQFAAIQSLSDCPCALELDRLSSAQRRNLLEAHIPFVAAPYQAYLPCWGSAFTERYLNDSVPQDAMAPATQCVFLHLFYKQDDGRTTAAEIAEALSFPKVTVSRAVNDLASLDLFLFVVEGRRKWITPTTNKPSLLAKAIAHMKSPVEKRVYVKSIPSSIHPQLGGIRALAQRTMVGANELDGSYVIERKDLSGIPKAYRIDEKAFRDFGGHILEVWSYNPKLLSASDAVDDVSLLLSLKEDTDERVQMGLDEIRRKYKLVDA